MTNIPLSDYMSGSFVGYTGSQGNLGYTGSIGYTGSQGVIGYTGSASTVIGYTGSKGDIGYTGSIPAALTATSLALGGATLGTNNLAVTGTVSVSATLNGTASTSDTIFPSSVPSGNGYSFVSGANYWGIREGTTHDFNIDIYNAGSPKNVLKINNAGSTSLTGLLDLSGASAGQIKFPATQNASADANTLDDYEEGTFTPVFSFAGGTTGMATSVSGNYVKIGKVVTVYIYFILTTKGSSTGQARFTSLPYTSAASQYGVGCVLNNLYGVTITGQLALNQWNTPGTTTIECWAINNGAQSTVTDTGFSNSTQFYPLFTYVTT